MSREETLRKLNGEINYYLALYETGLEFHDEEGLCRIALAKVDYIPDLANYIGLITVEEYKEMKKKIMEKKMKIMEEMKYGSR